MKEKVNKNSFALVTFGGSCWKHQWDGFAPSGSVSEPLVGLDTIW